MRIASLLPLVLVGGVAVVSCSGSDEPPANPWAGGGPTGTGGEQGDTGGAADTGGSGTAGTPGAGGAGTGGTECTNVTPTGTEWDEATCDQWAVETDECDSAWMVDNDYCNESCGRCTSSGSGGATGSGGTAGCDPGTTHTGGTQYCETYSAGGAGGDYHYEIWSDGAGSGCMTVFRDEATFKANWSNVGDFLARVGLRYNETQTHEQIGVFSSEFAVTKSGSNTTYIGIYGWSNDPLIEYYIIEDWMGSWRPSFSTRKGTITVDGGSYDVYTNVRENAPSIHGTQTFTQYYSVRTEGRQCGHISVSEHFSQWASLGMPLGKMYEVKLLVEGMNGSGDVEFTKATVVVR